MRGFNDGGEVETISIHHITRNKGLTFSRGTLGKRITVEMGQSLSDSDL